MISCNNKQPVVLLSVDSYFMPGHVKRNLIKIFESCHWFISDAEICNLHLANPETSVIFQKTESMSSQNQGSVGPLTQASEKK